MLRSKYLFELKDLILTSYILFPFFIIPVIYPLLICNPELRSYIIALISLGICVVGSAVFPIVCFFKKKIVIFLVLFLLFLLGFHAVFFLANLTHWTRDIPLLFYCASMFCVAFTLNDFDVFYNTALKMTICCAIYLSVVFLCYIIPFGKMTGYSMSLSYCILLMLCILLREIIEAPSLCYISLFTCLLFIALLKGSRGFLPCVFYFFASYVFHFISRGGRLRNSVVALGCLLFPIGALALYKKFLAASKLLGASKPLASRTIALVTKKTVHLSGRDAIYKSHLQAIIDHPFVGLGLWGDRTLKVVGLENTYSHNIVLEFFVQYGVPIGLILLGALFYLLISSYKKMMTSKMMALFNLFIATGLIPLFYSGSYLIWFPFAVLIGFSVNIKCTADAKVLAGNSQ